MARDIFERLDQRRLATEGVNSTRTQKIQHAQRLLDWLQRWSKPTVCYREIRIYGPYPRDRESTLNAAKILVENGWLTPIQTRRYDAHVWQVVRKPIVRPDVAT
jgi:hypothetical protein